MSGSFFFCFCIEKKLAGPGTFKGSDRLTVARALHATARAVHALPYAVLHAVHAVRAAGRSPQCKSPGVADGADASQERTTGMSHTAGSGAECGFYNSVHQERTAGTESHNVVPMLLRLFPCRLVNRCGLLVFWRFFTISAVSCCIGDVHCMTMPHAHICACSHPLSPPVTLFPPFSPFLTPCHPFSPLFAPSHLLAPPLTPYHPCRSATPLPQQAQQTQGQQAAAAHQLQQYQQQPKPIAHHKPLAQNLRQEMPPARVGGREWQNVGDC